MVTEHRRCTRTSRRCSSLQGSRLYKGRLSALPETPGAQQARICTLKSAALPIRSRQNYEPDLPFLTLKERRDFCGAASRFAASHTLCTRSARSASFSGVLGNRAAAINSCATSSGVCGFCSVSFVPNMRCLYTSRTENATPISEPSGGER